MLSKEILVQYCDLQEEIKEIRHRIDKNKKMLKEIEEGGNVADMVKGGAGGIQNFKIEGFPQARYDKVKACIKKNTTILQLREEKIFELLNEIDDFLNEIENGRVRRIISMRFIDGMSWVRVANNLGGNATPDSVRMEFNRYIEQ